MDGFMFGGPNNFPFGFWMPRGGQQPPEDREPPMRIRVAMDFLRLVTHKTSDGAVPHGVGAEHIEGQKLVPAETAAQTAACELLRNYFRGELKPDVWEEKAKEEKKENPAGVGRLISCVLCSGKQRPDPDCVFCKGMGTLLIYPTSASGGE